MKIGWIDHDTADHDSWCVDDMLLPAALQKLLREAGRFTPDYSWNTLHLKFNDTITLAHWHIFTTTHLDKDVFAPGLIHVTQCLPPSKDNHCQMLDFKYLIYGFIIYASILIKNKPENQDEDALGRLCNYGTGGLN